VNALQTFHGKFAAAAAICLGTAAIRFAAPNFVTSFRHPAPLVRAFFNLSEQPIDKRLRTSRTKSVGRALIGG